MSGRVLDWAIAALILPPIVGGLVFINYKFWSLVLAFL